jgi:aspartate aminotransferase
MTTYQPTAGIYELREAICQKLKKENDMHVDPEQVIVTPGAKFAIYLALQAVLETRDRVIILDPAWVSHPAIPAIMGAGVIRLATSELNGFQPDPKTLRNALDDSVKVIILNTPNNPTAAVYDKDLVRKIAEMAYDHGALLLSDEIYECLVFEGEHYSPGSEYPNVMTVNGFSKSHAMTGWRMGYATGPQEVLEGMIKIYQHSASCVTAFCQAGALEALQGAESRKAVRGMIDGYSKRRELMMGLLRDSTFFHCEHAQGAFYCFPSYSLEKPSALLARDLLEVAHVATVPGSAFGESGEGHLRLSYSASEEDIVKAFERIEAYVRDYC